MRICRVCKGMPDPAGYCPKCDKVRSKYEQIETEDIRVVIYCLYVDYVRRFHEQDAPTMLDYKDFMHEMYGDRVLVENILSMYGLHHRIGEYLSSLI